MSAAIAGIALLAVINGVFLLTDALLAKRAIRNERREAAKRRHPSSRRYYPRTNYRLIGE